MARPQRAHQSPRPSLTFVQPKRFRSFRQQRRAERALTWLPIIALVTFLVLAPFWLVRLTGWLIAR